MGGVRELQEVAESAARGADRLREVLLLQDAAGSDMRHGRRRLGRGGDGVG